MCVVPINFRQLRLPTASFQIDLIFTMQWQYCGNNWSEDDWCNICALFERCTGNYKLLLMDFVAFGCGLVDKIDKLMGSYLMTKEDPSVILDPVWELGPRMVPIVPRRQWMVDDDCNGFKFAPPKLYHPYHANKKKHHPPAWYWCDLCDMGHKSHTGQCTKTSADLFVAMTNYVCYHHDRDNYILPSPHLNVEITKDQRKAINPTTRNIQDKDRKLQSVR